MTLSWKYFFLLLFLFIYFTLYHDKNYLLFIAIFRFCIFRKEPSSKSRPILIFKSVFHAINFSMFSGDWLSLKQCVWLSKPTWFFYDILATAQSLNRNMNMILSFHISNEFQNCWPKISSVKCTFCDFPKLIPTEIAEDYLHLLNSTSFLHCGNISNFDH